MKVTRKEIDLLADSMKENGLTSIEYADENFSLKLGCHDFSGNPFVVNNENSLENTQETNEEKQKVIDENNGVGQEVKSPLVGNFYLTKKPGDAPFIKIGDQVEKGDVIAIVEAMKVMNEVKSPVSGVVKSIEVESGDFVDVDTVIMYIK